MASDETQKGLLNVNNEPKQTCLEKRGIEKRAELTTLNFNNGGYIQGTDTEYSDRHPNAISERHKVKGKSSQSGGHEYFRPYFGKPKEVLNEINYSNFITVSDKAGTIGGKIDIDKREELSTTSRYAYGINEYSSKNIDAKSDGYVQGKGTGLYLDTTNGGGGYDVEARVLQTRKNVWRKEDIEYSRPLVLAEYDIQTEFKISSAAEKFEEAEAKKKAKEEASLLRKTEKSNTVKAKNKRKNSQPDTLPGIPTDAQPGGAKKNPLNQ